MKLLASLRTRPMTAGLAASILLAATLVLANPGSAPIEFAPADVEMALLQQGQVAAAIIPCSPCPASDATDCSSPVRACSDTLTSCFCFFCNGMVQCSIF